MSRGLLREPLLHFTLIGALLFGIDAALAVVVLMGASLLTPFVLPPPGRLPNLIFSSCSSSFRKTVSWASSSA